MCVFADTQLSTLQNQAMHAANSKTLSTKGCHLDRRERSQDFAKFLRAVLAEMTSTIVPTLQRGNKDWTLQHPSCHFSIKQRMQLTAKPCRRRDVISTAGRDLSALRDFSSLCSSMTSTICSHAPAWVQNKAWTLQRPFCHFKIKQRMQLTAKPCRRRCVISTVGRDLKALRDFSSLYSSKLTSRHAYDCTHAPAWVQNKAWTLQRPFCHFSIKQRMLTAKPCPRRSVISTVGRDLSALRDFSSLCS